MPRKRKEPHPDIDPPKREFAQTGHGIWVGTSRIKPRFFSRPLQPGEVDNDTDTWLLRVACWHSSTATVTFTDERTLRAWEWWARINSCRFVGCSEVVIQPSRHRSNYRYQPPPYHAPDTDAGDG